MSNFNKSVLFTVALSLAACGEAIVRFPLATPPVVPAVGSTSPAADATGVGTGRTIQATFTELMAPATLNGTTFFLKQGAASVAGSVSYSGLTATFEPTAALAINTTYTATVTAGAKSALDSTPMAADHTWSFTTANVAAPAPTVTGTTPGDGSTGIVTGIVPTARFSRPMLASSLTTVTFKLNDGATAVPGLVTYSGSTATFTPTATLDNDTAYTARITTGATDPDGIALDADHVWTFTTVTAVVVAPPFVFSTVPGNGSTGIPVNQQVSAVFSRTMDPLTITGTTFTLKDGVTPVAGTVSYTGTTATFAPTALLANDKTYTATLTTGAKDAAGLALAADYSWTFTTTGAVVVAPPVVLSTSPGHTSTGVALSQQLTANFSRAMDPLTITGTTFTMKTGITPVTGTVTYSGTTARFVPTAALTAGTTYTATITTGAKDPAGIALAADYTWSFTTLTPLAPTVISNVPGNGSTGVAPSTPVSATFSRNMDPLTITGTTFTVLDGVTPVPGNVTYVGVTATFTPTAPLVNGKTYTATITTGAKDTAGIALASNHVWTFTTAALEALQVTSTDPANNSTGVPLDQVVAATFNRAMNPTTITNLTFTLAQGLTPVVGTVSYAGFDAEFTPTAPLLPQLAYTATITTGAKDTNGIGLTVAKSWTFTTAAPLAPSPEVVSTNPAAGASGLCIPVKVDAEFNVPMDGQTINGQSFTLTAPGPTPIAGAVTYDIEQNVASFAPSAALAGATTYTATLTIAVESQDGMPLLLPKMWTFTTSMTPCTVGIDLGSLTTFVAVAGAGLTNSNSQLPAVTTLNGDVGLHPTGSCISDGSPCNPAAGAPRINGNLYMNDPAGKAAAAKADLVSAYNNAMGRPVGTTIVANLAGQTLAPGVYSSDSTMDIAVGGTLTLDGQGDQNATWIFRVGSALTANNGSMVVLIGGAKAKNVFWAIGSSSTIGSNASFKGTVMAVQSNSVGTGSVVEGRLVCTNGAITLLSNTITLPAE